MGHAVTQIKKVYTQLLCCIQIEKDAFATHTNTHTHLYISIEFEIIFFRRSHLYVVKHMLLSFYAFIYECRKRKRLWRIIGRMQQNTGNFWNPVTLLRYILKNVVHSVIETSYYMFFLCKNLEPFFFSFFLLYFR